MKNDPKKVKNTPHYHGHRERLRNKLSISPESLAGYELLELLLGYSIPRKDVKPLAKQLISHFKSIHGVMNASTDELLEISGISVNTATLIKLIRELDTRSLETELKQKIAITSPTDVLGFARKKLEHLVDEAVMVIYINARNKIENYEIINEGTTDKVVLYPRNIIKNALKHNATGVILIHNHPSSECEPSGNDIRITGDIITAAKAMDIRVLDHLIVSANGYFSFAENHLI